MDARHFDDLTRSLSSGASRRRLLAGLASGLLAALSLVSTGEVAGARNKNKKRKKKACGHREKRCGGKCVNLLTDAKHCGKCNSRCPGAEGCLHGTCTCDPFNNTCPLDETPAEPGDPCRCGAVVGGQTACADGNSACDLEPCDSHDDCPPRSVCLLGCADDTDPDGPRRCSTPCN